MWNASWVSTTSHYALRIEHYADLKFSTKHEALCRETAADMSRLSRWLVAFWIAVAIWMSDRWVWILPALIGVVVGTAISRAQSKHPRARDKALRPREMGSLMVLTSFVYLYLAFIVFQVRRVHELLQLEEPIEPPPAWLLVGLMGLSFLAVGLGAVLLSRTIIPRWLSRLWDRLLEDL